MLKYQKIAEELRQAIRRGEYLPGDKIPLEKDMGKRYGVCRLTVKRAVDLLVKQGLVAKRRGAGAFVKSLDGQAVKELSMAHQFSGFAETYRAQKIHTECLRFEIINPSVEVAARLKIDEEDFVYDIIRVRYLNDEPVVIEYTKMPIQLIPGISIEVLLDSIYAYIEGALKLNIQSAHRIVRAGMPTPLESGYLRIEDGMPILEVEQTAFLDDGRPFEYSISRHRADKSAFKAVSVR